MLHFMLDGDSLWGKRKAQAVFSDTTSILQFTCVTFKFATDLQEHIVTIHFHCLFFSRRWAVFSFCFKWKLRMHLRRRLIENTTTAMSHKNRGDVFWYKTLMNVLSHVMILDEETSGPSEQI